MKRRDFIKSGAGAFSTVLLGNASYKSAQWPDDRSGPGGNGLDFHVNREYPGRREPKTMLFWDYWKFHETDNAELAQGKPEWRPEGTYIDPYTKNSGSGRVFFHQPSGKWRKISLDINYRKKMGGHFYVMESEDGIRWQPAPFPDIIPHGGKKAPHHVYTVPGEGPCFGWLYLDPVAADGYPYKVPVIEKMQRVYDRAKADKNHRWHHLTKKFSGPRNHMSDYIVYVSKDGLHWETKTEYDWCQGKFFPEEPHFMFFNHLSGRHTLVARPGLGDRRALITSTKDFREWSEPRIVLQPDLLDRKILEFYTMPVFPYGSCFVGLAWASHFSSSEGPDFMVLHKGPQNPQLVWSPDGEYFVRPTRESFIEFNPPGKPGCNSIRPEGMVVLEDEIRIYSQGGLSAHGTPVPESMQPSSSGMLLHTLRRDGFMYFRSKGYKASLTTRPFIIFNCDITMNAEAVTGEVLVEIRDDKNKPIEGYTFDEFIPLKFSDSLKHPLQWRNRRNLNELINKPIRFSIKFYNARIYSFTGDYHFTDAHDARRLRDGLPVDDTSRFGS